MAGSARARIWILSAAMALAAVAATAQVTNPARDALRRGMALHKAGKLREALVEYSKARDLDRGWAEPLRMIGLLQRSQGQLDAAIASYRSALTLEPTLAAAHNDLGVALRMKGDLPAALASFQEALKHNPKFVQASYNIACVFYDQNKVSEAMEALQSTLRMDPKFAPAHYNTAVVLGRMDRWPQALKSAERACQLDGTEPRNWLLLAWCHYKIGETERALELARRGAEKAPKLAEAHYLIGFIATSRRNLDAAIPAYENALKLDSRAGLARAIEELRRELALDTSVPEAQYSLGYLLQAQENRADALAAYQAFLQSAKPGKWADRAKDSIALLK